jgi:hypothetical protein
MRAGAIRSSLQGPDASEGRNSLGAVLPRAALVWALSALTQAFRIPFDEKLVTGQMPPPYGVNSIVLGADLLGLRAAWAKRPASALRKLVAPFLVLLSPALREPHNGLVAGRESLASLDSAVPNQRLAFLLRVEGDRVALFEQGVDFSSQLCLFFNSDRSGFALAFRCIAKRLVSSSVGHLPTKSRVGFAWKSTCSVHKDVFAEYRWVRRHCAKAPQGW